MPLVAVLVAADNSSGRGSGFTHILVVIKKWSLQYDPVKVIIWACSMLMTYKAKTVLTL